jgi:hypothetical protein
METGEIGLALHGVCEVVGQPTVLVASLVIFPTVSPIVFPIVSPTPRASLYAVDP